ncbi:MAG: hypothetical protein KatS3mg105_2745 [Gemmatales bacterium]|nr:MAG: hypothetical protein KatS3mg105_2745 [Gemmatales bacterium]
MTTKLPESLRVKFNAVCRRVRLLQFVRGASLLVMVLLSMAATALLADFAFALPAATRLGFLLLWTAVAVGGTLRWLVLPCVRPIPAEALAAAIEQKYPSLEERLTSTVELASENETHGAPEFISHLIQDTASKTQGIPFEPVFSGRRAAQLAIAAGLFILLGMLPGVLWPHKTAQLVERFICPLQADPAVTLYRIAVTPGDAIVARGRPMTISAVVSPTRQGVGLPRECHLVIESHGQVEKIRMPFTSDNRFAVELEAVPGNFRYFIETANGASDSYSVTAIEPVELADGTNITIVPPEYARKTFPEETHSSLVNLASLQYSDVQWRLQFNRPAVRAFLEWLPKRQTKKDQGQAPLPRLIPVELSSDRTEGLVHFQAKEHGIYRLILVAEHDIRTETAEREFVVQIDSPPVFTNRKFGGEDIKTAHPLDSLKFEVALADDVGVDFAAIEYRVDQGQIHREAIALQGRGLRDARGQHTFHLSGKVRDGQVLYYRFVGADNRLVPAASLQPHVIYFPPERRPGEARWFSLRITQSSKPLEEQNILARRDEINQRIDAILNNLRAERAQLKSFQKESEEQPALTPKQQEKLQQIRRQNRGTELDLHELARRMENEAAFLPLAEQVRRIADEQLRTSDRHLQEAGKATQAQPRNAHLQSSDKQLEQAMQRLEQIKKQNQELADVRREQLALKSLAKRQEELARLAAEQAQRDLIRDPDARKALEELKAAQQKLAQELQQQTRAQPFQLALDAARAEQLKQLADQAKKLSEAQEQLTHQASQTDMLRRRQMLEELARKQRELANQAALLAKETELPAQAAKAKPLDPQASQQAAQLLDEGDPRKALALQDQSARDLERLGRELDRAIQLSEDPREAARQLAQLQEALRNKTAEEVSRKNAQEPLTSRLKPLIEEQRALERAAAQLSVPAENERARKAQQQAVHEAEEAAKALQERDSAVAQRRMDRVQRALEEVARNLPSLRDRRAAAEAALRRLQQEQVRVKQDAEKALAQFEKDKSKMSRSQLAERLADAARRQAEIADKLASLDTPNEEGRRQQAENAVQQALADLMDAKAQDIRASQAEAQRRLQDLRTKLAGGKTEDERAAELAEQQEQLKRDAQRAATNPNTTPQEKQALQNRQQQIAEQARRLAAPQAPQRLAEAQQQTRKAAEAAVNPTHPEALQQMDKAAEALKQLARQLAGQESEAQRAERLAQKQAELAAQQERLARKVPHARPTQQQRLEQNRTAQEAEMIRAGEEAQAEKEKALQALHQAQTAANADELAKAQRQAADALRKLADKLAGRDDPAAQAAEIARQQQKLAQAANKADPQKDPQAKQQLADKQAELARRLAQLDTQGAEKQKAQTNARMQAAKAALEKASNPSQARKALVEAAEAASQLAKELARQTANRPQSEPTVRTSAKPSDSPQKAAQQLAEQQRKLAEATAKAAEERRPQAQKKALAKVAAQQQQLNRQASQLDAPKGHRALQQARALMNKAQQSLEQNQPGEARKLQNQAAQALQDLAKKLPQHGQQPTAQQSSGKPKGLPTPQQAAKARQLAQQQRQLQQEVQKAIQQLAKPIATQVAQNTAAELARQQQQIAKAAQKLAQQVAQQNGKQATPSAPGTKGRSSSWRGSQTSAG